MFPSRTSKSEISATIKKKTISPVNPVPDAAFFQCTCFGRSHWGFPHYLESTLCLTQPFGFHLDLHEGRKMKHGFPDGSENAPRSRWVSRPHSSAFGLLHLDAAHFTKTGKTRVLCIGSATVIGRSPLFAARRLHPAGCVLGVPSVVWESDAARGIFTRCSTAIWPPSLHHMHLTSFKRLWLYLILFLFFASFWFIK